MIDHARRNVVVGCLFIFCMSAAAQQPENPPKLQPTQPVKPPFSTRPPAQPLAPQPGMLQPVPAQPGLIQTVPPSVVVTTSAPVTLPLPRPVPEPALGSELHSQIRENEQHYREKNAAAKNDFKLRQDEENKQFEATLAGKGFWERGRMKREFRQAQNKRRQEFDAEQEKRRRTYEWRYP